MAGLPLEYDRYSAEVLAIILQKGEKVHQIRLCKRDELEKLQTYIYESIERDNILVKNSDLLNWQYLDKSHGAYNFIVAYNTETKAFDAILGFIPTWHYDNNLRNERDIWLTLWRNDKIKAGRKLLGINLLYYLERVYKPRSIGGAGISAIAMKIYNFLKYKTGILRHYYLLNPHVSAYNIADVKRKEIKIQHNGGNADITVKEIRDLKEISKIKSSFKPKKSTEYFYNRFCNHPAYRYHFYGVYFFEKLETVLVIRKITVNNSSCLRIVDILGSLIPESLQGELEKILIQESAEYIDCLNYGIDKNIFYSMGFSERADNNIVIPNNFEPFERKNVNTEFAYKTDYANYVIFKGDSNRDKPNQ